MFSPPATSHDFTNAFLGLLPVCVADRLAGIHGPRKAAKPKLTIWQLIMARAYHELARVGNFSASVKEITGTVVSDSALSQRLQSVGHHLFEAILPEVLKPLAVEGRHPDGFYHSHRLLAIDGVRFNLRNTEGINSKACKTPCPRGGGEPAFAQLRAVVLVELGHHQPLGAAMGWRQEGEQTLFRKLLATATLPARSLILCDRLYGTPSIIREIKGRLDETGSAILFRVRANLVAKRIRQLADGSRLVRVNVICPETHRKTGTLELREINATISYEGSEAPLEIRLWTTLLDDVAHPAPELAALYSERWEEELFFRELKSHLHRKNNLLDAQTPETAAQEVVALLLAAVLIAEQRAVVAGLAGVPVRRISFAKVYHKTAGLYELAATARGLAPEGFLIAYAQRMLEELRTSAVIQHRPDRSCPRTLRQPVKDWPKTRNPSSEKIKKTITISNP